MKKQGSYSGGWSARVNHDSEWIQVQNGNDIFYVYIYLFVSFDLSPIVFLFCMLLPDTSLPWLVGRVTALFVRLQVFLPAV